MEHDTGCLLPIENTKKSRFKNIFNSFHQRSAIHYIPISRASPPPSPSISLSLSPTISLSLFIPPRSDGQNFQCELFANLSYENKLLKSHLDSPQMKINRHKAIFYKWERSV